MRAEEQKREKYLPTLLIQQIRLQWYKDCRGGNAAAQRNQYPRAMRLPKDFFSYYSFGLPTHFVSILQRPDGFQINKDCRRLMEWKLNGTMRVHSFELIQQESGIQVRYRYDWHIGAMPERYTYDKTGQKQPLNELALDLIPGDYGRAIVQWEVSRLGHRDLVLCAGHFECDAAYRTHRRIDQFYGQRTEYDIYPDRPAVVMKNRRITT